jgi:RimJ/RimL family protein N-acetyltransferase
VELTTSRCLLRPVAAGDLEPLHRLWSSAGVRRFLWDDEVIPIARAAEAINQSERLFREQGFGLWGAASRRIDGPRELIAFAGLWPFRDPPEIELVYGVAEPLWGQGLAAEIARAVIAHCFHTLGMPSLRASTDAANAASVRVLDTLGFSLLRRSTVAGLDTVFYERRR